MWFMCRSKKITVFLLGMAAAAAFSGCSLKTALFSDTGSSRQEQVNREDYLKTDALEQSEAGNGDKKYKVYTLELETFGEDARKQTLKRCFINAPTVRLDVDGVEARFGEYIANYGQYVEKGDVIATVYTEVDTVAVEEAQIRADRLRERYTAAEAQMQEDLQDILDAKGINYNYYEQQIYDVQYRQRQQDWELEKFNFEAQIKAADKTLNKLTKIGSVYEIKATDSGYVSMETKYAAGTKLKDGTVICQILNNNVIYAQGTQQTEDFSYGMEAEITTPQGMVPALVANGGSRILYGNLDKGETIFRLEIADGKQSEVLTGYNNLVLNGEVKTIQNVVTVPKKAVTEKDDKYFVTVLKEDGTLLKTQFLPGGSNTEVYWVMDGLTAGTRIVYN